MSGPGDSVHIGIPGSYRLLQRLGRGMYGEVWRAEAPGGVEVALKIIARTIKPEEANRELDALQVVKRLRHQNLLSLQAFFAQEHQLVIVLELADRSLRQRLAECRKAGESGIPPAELLAYFREATEALDYLHAHGVQHRDIKPDNVLLLGSHVKVADCGLARMLERHSLQTASTVGTPAYMAPEVWAGKVTLHSDQYSLAVTYAELRLGRLPFPSETLPGLIQAHLNGQPDLSPLDGAERRVLERALAKSPEGRFPSCVQFVHALSDAIVEQLTRDPAPPGALATASAPPVGASALRTPSPSSSWPVPGGTDWSVSVSDGSGQGPDAAPGMGQKTAGAQGTLRAEPPAAGAPEKTATEGKPSADLTTPGDWRGTPPAPTRGRWPVGLVLAGLLAAGVGLLIWQLPGFFEDTSPPGGQAEAPAQPAKGTPALPVKDTTTPPKKSEPPPKAALELLPVEGVTLEAGKGGLAEVRVRRQNCKGPVRLRVEGLPAGVQAVVEPLSADTDTAVLRLAADEDAAEGTRDVTVRAELGSLRADRTVRLTVQVKPALRLAALKKVTVEPGQRWTLGVRFRRVKWAGPLEVRLEGLPEGVTAWRGTVPADREAAGVTFIVRSYAPATTAKVRLVARGAGLKAEQTVPLEVRPARAKGELLAEAKLAVKKAPKDPVAYLNLGHAYRQLRQFDNAAENYDEAVRLDPKSAPAYLDRGGLYLLLKAYPAAVKDFNEAIRLDPRSPYGYNGRGNARRAANELEEAIKDYESAVRLDPKWALAYRNRGVAYTRLREYDSALADFGEALRLDPRDAVAYLERGNARGLKGEYDEAAADFTEAIRIDPNFARAHAYRGNLRRLQKQYKQALADYGEAIRLDPRVARFRVGRGNVYFERRAYPLAINDYTEALRLDPNYAAAYYHRANAHRARGDLPKALDDYGSAIRVNPAYVSAYVDRGNVHRLLKDYDRAVEDCSQALALAPGSASAHNTRGLAYLGKKDPDKALADFDEAVRLAPKYAAARHNRANAYFEKKEFDRAIEDCDEVIRLEPGNALAYNSRGAAYSRKGEHKRAIEDYTEAIRLSPKYALAYANRCRAHRSVGDLKRARADRARAVELDPSFDSILPRLPPAKGSKAAPKITTST
jgi:tetratricopeptide (TPR) repeat protein/serine/threonine protein kinase